jgi:altronate dehydratase large subunit
MADTFLAFRRETGQVGIRDHLLVLPTTGAVNRVCDLVQIARPEAVCVTHQGGSPGGDEELLLRVLAGFAANPNVRAVVLVGLGDPDDSLESVATSAERLGARVLSVTVLGAGGVRAAAERVCALLDGEGASRVREPVALDELVLGTECGASDGYSGLTANPALGVCSDLLVEAGGTAILAEMTELIGVEHVIAARASSAEVRERFLAVVRGWEDFTAAFGEDIRGAQPTPGNIEGGLTTIEEKSLGCAYKAGRSPLVEVVRYGERPSRRGLVVMDTPGHDVEQLTGMAAGGAQCVAFTTGRGTPTASPIAPTIKVATNSRIAARFADHIDLDAGGIAAGRETIDEVGRSLFAKVIAVASGEPTKAELFRQRDFAIPRTAPSLR